MQNKNTITDWDRLAAQSINSVLAPKGFVKMANGHWKGMEKAKSDHPFLSKKKVFEARAVAAQLVRNYREGVRFELTDRANKVKAEMEKAEADLLSCGFWELSKKRIFTKARDHYRNQWGLLAILINEIDTIKVK